MRKRAVAAILKRQRERPGDVLFQDYIEAMSRAFARRLRRVRAEFFAADLIAPLDYATHAPHTAPKRLRRRKEETDQQFAERIRMAVTESE